MMPEENIVVEAISVDELAQDAKEAVKSVVTLADVRELAEQQKLLDEEVLAIEVQLEMKKAELREIAEEKLPEMLNTVGLKEITLKDGSKIKIADRVSASITDDNREVAHAWVRSIGCEDLIKNVVSVTFGKGEDKDAQLLVHNINVMADNGALHFGTVDQKEAIHPSTLKALVKERLKEGLPVPADKLKLYVGEICQISKPRNK